MFLEITLIHHTLRNLKVTEKEYKEALQVVKRQLKAELGWEAEVVIIKEEGD